MKVQLNASKKCHIERILLSTDAKTQNRLTSLFLLPNTLSSILNTAPKTLETVGAVKLFLLTRWSELSSAINFRDKEKALAALELFINVWIKSKQPVSRLSFQNNCTIKEDCTAIWVPEVNNLLVANVKKLTSIKNEWLNYSKNFDVIETNEGFVAEIEFFRYNSIPSTFEPKSKSVVKQLSKPASDYTGNNSAFGYGVAAEKLFQAIEMHLQENDRVARAFAKPDFSALNGRQVQGGLPSLGKRR